jgi:hypothetical protein
MTTSAKTSGEFPWAAIFDKRRHSVIANLGKHFEFHRKLPLNCSD